MNEPLSLNGVPSEAYTRIVKHARVFARMSPDHKAMLVTEIQKENKEIMVAM